jgi:hypothetical protein
MTDDRRKHSRIPLSLTVVWESASGKYEARASDISLGGCFIDTIGLVAVGDTISFKLRISETETIELDGEVVSELPRFGFGVRYINLSDENRLRLKSIIGSEE